MAQQATGPHAEPGESAGLLQNHDSSLAHRPAEEPAHSPLQRAAAAAAAAGAAAWESGITCILLAAFSYAWAASFVKLAKLSAPGLSVFEIVVVRSMLAMAASCGVAGGRNGTPLYGARRHWHLLAARGLVGATTVTLFYASLVRIPLADTMTLMFLNPSICALLGWALLGEHSGWRTACGCLASLVGVTCIAQPPFLFGAAHAWSAQRVAGVVCGVLSAVSAALAYICVRRSGKREASITVAMWFHTCSAATSAVPLALGYPQAAIAPNGKACAYLLAVAGCAFVAQLLLNRGFQIETASRASSANYSQVVWAALIGVVLFGEPITLLGGLGALLVAVGVMAVASDKQPLLGTALEAKDSFKLSTGQLEDGMPREGGGGGTAYMQLTPLPGESYR